MLQALASACVFLLWSLSPAFARQQRLMRSSIVREAEVMVSAAGKADPAMQSSSGTGSNEAASSVAQVLVLINNHETSRKRFAQLQAKLANILPAELHPTPVMGIDAFQYKTQTELEDQQQIGMSEQDKADWHELTRLPLGAMQNYHPDPSLACSLGHKKMWMMVANTTSEGWTVILEDDAMPTTDFSWQQMAEMLQSVNSQADEIFLDDRHCKNVDPGLHRGQPFGIMSGESSAAYAIKRSTARELLISPLSLHTDRILNRAIASGKLAAFCPSRAFFTVSYTHQSQIGDTLLKIPGGNI